MHPSMTPMEFVWGLCLTVLMVVVLRRFLMWFLGIDRLHVLLEDVVRVSQGQPPLMVGKPSAWQRLVNAVRKKS